MTNIAIIGFGYWGPNLARNFSTTPNTRIRWICDLNPKLLQEARRLYPSTQITTNIRDVLHNTTTSAVVIATPLATHVPLARLALAANKHVLVEKPLALGAKEARQLERFAKARKRVIMVDHTYLYTPEVSKIYDIIRSGTLGNVFFVDSVRTNLGLVQTDTNVIYDLATHDFSIVDFLFGKEPQMISATGFSHKGMKQEAVAYITARYPQGLFFHTHVSWLSPAKVRTMTFVGSKKMLVYNDMEPSEKIKIYDKGISITQLRIGYRTGSMIAPHFPIKEGLAGMAAEFVSAVTTGKKPLSDGMSALRVVRCVETATKSIRTGGKTITL